mmetsp:Transcript_117137/g.364764  ORF Transcript_117137/g.364764 Transcript_117137/m.364764 type:complete len:292 (+) Transcript_117137:255-1130(+)
MGIKPWPCCIIAAACCICHCCCCCAWRSRISASIFSMRSSWFQPWSSPSTSPICWKRKTPSSAISRALPNSWLWQLMSASRMRPDASPSAEPALRKMPRASSTALLASGSLPFMSCVCATVKSAAPRTAGESSFRAMETASFAILVVLSAVDLCSFSLPFPSSSFSTNCFSRTWQVITMVDTSSSLWPSSLTMVRSEPNALSAWSYSFSAMCTLMRVLRATASLAWSCTSFDLSCASFAEAAAFLWSPSANCALESCSRAETSPSRSCASWKSSRASVDSASARPVSFFSR